MLLVQSAILKQYFVNTFKDRSCRMTGYLGILPENYFHCYSHILFSEEM